MFSFSTLAPVSSILAASSTTGPLTSYNTLSNLVDFLNSLITAFPPILEYVECKNCGSLGAAGIYGGTWFLWKEEPHNQSGSTFNVSAKNMAIFFLGRVFPLIY